MKRFYVFREARPATRPQNKVLRFDMGLDLAQPDTKKFREIKEDGRLVDVLDVRLVGYLSTFANITEADRDGDRVEKGAFTESIPLFMRNPVLLVNHRNDVQAVAGSFSTVREDNVGLYVEARLSNSPAEWMRDIRFKVAEGHLRTMSMGGLFYYREDGRTIFKVSLWEGSLTPIPANPDAMFSVRSLTDQEAKAVGL